MNQTNPITWTAPNCSTPEERAHAKELYEQGMIVPEIAEQLNRANSTVYEWITGRSKQSTDYKIQEWKGKASDDEKLEAVRLFQQHGSVNEVCKILDRSYDTVRRWLKAHGVDTSKPKTHTIESGLQAELKMLRAENQKLKDTIVSLAAQLTK
jgi:transposase-like protein